jgi:hypothetical protein
MMIGRASTWLIPALVAAALLCVGVAAPAHAQPDEKRAGTAKESTRLMLEFAECTARKRKIKPEIDRFLRMSPANPEFGVLARKFANDNCMPTNLMAEVRMTFDSLLFRYGLFEARYRIEFGKGSPPAIVDLPPLDFENEFDLTISADLKGVESLPPLVVFLRKLSQCLILERPAEAHALVIARPYSDAETKALPPVIEVLGACIGEGQTLKFSRPMLRGAIAEALYKAATRPRPSTPAKETGQ